MKTIPHASVALALILSAAGFLASGEQATAEDKSDRKAWFGELHVHSANSFDSYFESVRAGPEDAYRFALGEAVNVGGITARIKAPLDFLAVTDHAMYLGMLPAFNVEGHPAAALPVAEKFRSNEEMPFADYWQMLFPKTEAERVIPIDVVNNTVRETWAEYAKLAEKYYVPGKFTTLVGYEWTSAVKAQGLHRNIIFRGTDVPEVIFSTLDSTNPEDLWAWMETVREGGAELLAIPHNSNQSNGLMFPDSRWDGSPLDAAWAEIRTRNEPLVEVSQIKGTSETVPALSPNDEWASFEIMDERMGTNGLRSKPQGSYVRQAYKDGLAISSKQGFNPYKFGMIGASDGHNSISASEEDNYTGKVVGIDGTPELRRSSGSGIARHNWMLSASGLAGVWAAENTRGQIFDALKRKEAFATSGPRIKVRLFAGWDFPTDMMDQKNWVQQGYQKGVPMGADLQARPDGADTPQFAVWAMKDPAGAWLQRLQIVKGWVDTAGETHEQVYDVACAGNSQPDPETFRCPDNGAAVNLKTCEVARSNGNVALATVWSDPQFDAETSAFYYVRAIENPSCRWSTWEAIRSGWPILDTVAATLQERAWSSPIWYEPT